MDDNNIIDEVVKEIYRRNLALVRMNRTLRLWLVICFIFIGLLILLSIFI